VRNLFILSLLSFLLSPISTVAQISVTAGCVSAQFGSGCTFTAGGTLGAIINWQISNGSWEGVSPGNPANQWNVDNEKINMLATCRALTRWYNQNMTVRISSNGYSASVDVPVQCSGPKLGNCLIRKIPTAGIKPATAIAIATFENTYASSLPGSGDFVHYPNGWEYLENGQWKSLVTHASDGESPTGVKIFAFKQCLLIDSTPWSSKESKLYFKTIPINFSGLTIRKWVERCEGEMAYGTELVIPSAVTMGNNAFAVNEIQAWAMGEAENQMRLRVSDSQWKVVSVISLTGQILNWKQTEDSYVIQSHSMPGTIRVGVSNGQVCHWINPNWVH